MRKTTIAGLILLAFCIACRFCRPVADFYAINVYPLISSVLSFVASALPVSLEEIAVLGFVLAFIIILVRAIGKKKGFFRWLGKVAVLLMWLYVWFYMGWGNNYYRTGLYRRSGIERVSYEQEEFNRFLAEFTDGLNSAAAAAGEYDRGEVETEIKTFYSERVSTCGYSRLHSWQHVKRPLLNPLFSAVGVKGFMGPFFCESQVNLSLLDFEYPFTLAHEMGHLAGVTSEAEANYWGFVFCRDCPNAAVRYSGYQAILPYVLSNAWNLLPEDEFNAWKETVCLKAREDYSASRQFWIGKRVDWIDRFQSRFYNLYLRSNGISEGLKDYFGVVEMIMTMDASRPSVQQ